MQPTYKNRLFGGGVGGGGGGGDDYFLYIFVATM